MSTTNLNVLTLDELVDHYVAWFKQEITEEYRSLFVPLLRELATGQPVEPRRVADSARVSLEQTLALLRQTSTEWDTDGERVVGWGLTSIRTPHRYETQGQVLWARCAVEALEFPVVIGAPARVQSPCAATGDPITIHLTPTGVERVEPASAVVSDFPPATDPSGCDQNNYYRSVEAAAAWLAEHPQGRALPVAELFEVLRRAILRLWGKELGPS